MQLPRSDWEAYRRSLSQQQQQAADLVARSIKAYARMNPGYTVAEMRDYAIEMMAQALRTYGATGATLAAAEYDKTMQLAGFSVAAADIFDELDEDWLTEKVHYQAGKLVTGDRDGFTRMLAQAAADHVNRSANHTSIENAVRDRDAGVKFARILTGRENCTFCTMLASRGFVYATRESAGAYDQWHRFCDCRVVAGVDGIEGYDLDGLYDRWRAFEDIDARAHDDGTPWTKKERDAAKLEYAGKHPVWSE